MKYVNTDNSEHSLINLEKISEIETYDYDRGDYRINFYIESYHFSWHFENIKERDDIYSKILKIADVTNLSNNFQL